MNDELYCMRCGCEMTVREHCQGDGLCFCCAPVYGAKDLRRPFNESAIEMGCAEMVD